MDGFRLLDSTADAAEFMSWLGERREVLAVDTETSGLDWTRDELRLVQFGDSRGAWSIPADRWLGVAAEALDAYVGDICLHNHKFDSHFLREAGVKLPVRRHDTMTMARLNRPDRRVGLKALCRAMKHPMVEHAAVLDDHMKRHGGGWAEVDPRDPVLWRYGAADCVMTADIWLAERAAAGTALYEMEMASQIALEAMERRGMPIDRPYLERLGEHLGAERQEISAECRKAGVDLASRKEVIAALLAEGWQPAALTPKGEPSLTVEGLDGFDSPTAASYRRYKSLEKQQSTWVDPLIQMERGGRVHPSINPVGAATGRMSSSIHTLPRKAAIRNAFKAPDGHKLVACDYSQQELRLIAALTGDESLKSVFDGDDAHTAIARQVWQKDDIAPEERQTSKNAVFAVCYGAGAKRLADSFGFPIERAEQIREQFYSAFPVATSAPLMMGSAAQMLGGRHMYLRTPFGRMQVAELDKPYLLVNHMVQGTGADVLKSAIVRLDRSDVGEFAVCPYHDEIIAEVPADAADDVAAEIAATMTDDRFDPALVAEAVVMDRWGDKYE